MRKSFIVLFLKCTLILLLTYTTLRKCSIRPPFEPQAILVNPAGTCALVEYHFRGGERWWWLDPYAHFTLSSGDAFYTVVDLKTNNIIRDSTRSIISVPAYSQGSVGMGRSVFYWSSDGKTAAFPGGEGPAHEWTDITQCEGSLPQTAYANLDCETPEQSDHCKTLGAVLR